MRIRPRAVVALFVLLSAPALGAQGPWTVTIRPTANPLPIGSCHTVLLTLVDPSTRGTPRAASGKYVSIVDFDMAVESAGKPAVVGKYESASIWSVCACQSATIGGQGVITATYPAKSLPEESRVPGVAFKSQVPFTFSAAEGKYNPAGCAALETAALGATAAGGAAGAASGGAAGAASGGAAAGGAAGGAAGSAASGGAAVGGAAVGGAAAGGAAAGGAAVGGAAAGGAAAGGAAAGGVAAGGAAAGGAAAGGAAAGGAAAGGATSGGAPTGGASGAASGGAAGGAASAGATPAGPGPQNVRVLASDSPLVVEVLAWDRLPGITGYNVYIKTNAESGKWILATSKPLLTERFTDSELRRAGTMYRVTALYADGRQGSTDFLYKGR